MDRPAQGQGHRFPKDRFAAFPITLTPLLQSHLARVNALHRQALSQGHGEVYPPHVLTRKYPNTAREWGWQYIVPTRNLSVDPHSGVTRRHHADPASSTRPLN
jgi:hypothetical protein